MVPQGSVLGPLLFTILISDIDKGIDFSLLLSYADDTKTFTGIKDQLDRIKLQKDLDVLYDWAIDNGQEFNAKKFLHLGITLLQTVSDGYLNSDASIILSTHFVKDLGIIFSTDGSFRHHINTIVAKTKRFIGWIMRTFITRDKLTMMTLLKQLVYPSIEYCCPLWSPVKQDLIKHLEKIQKSFTKKLRGWKH